MTLKNFPTLNDLKNLGPIQLICFDMDGTLFNTEFIHAQALLDIGKALKIKLDLPIEEIEKRFHGKADIQVYKELEKMGQKPSISEEEFIALKNQLMMPLIEKTPTKQYFSDGLLVFLNECQKNQIKLAVVTSSERSIMEKLLDCSQISNLFHFTMTRNEALKIKPDPWPYVETMKHFNLQPSQTLIFEDSNVGIESARASGAHYCLVKWWHS